MKIAQVCHVYLPHMGGLEFFVDRLYTSLINSGNSSTIITTDMKTGPENRKSHAIYNKVQISYMGNPVSLGVMKYIKQNHVDLIQLHSIWFIPSFEAALVAKNKNIVTIIHGVYPNIATKYQKFMLFMYKPFANYVLNKSKLILVQSVSEKEKLMQHFKVNPDIIRVIYNGINLDNDRRKISTKEKVILFTGRIIRDKNPDILIKAAGLLKAKGYNFKVKFIGPISSEFLEELKTLSENSGLKDDVIFMDNIPPERRSDLMKEYKKCFTFVAIGSWEGLPNRAMEAMQYGIPCIAYDSGGTGELVIDNECGLLIKDLNEKELMQKLELLFKDKKLYDKLGKNAKKIVESKFDWNKTYKIIENSYKEIIK